MAVPIHFLINSPHGSSDEEYNGSEISSSEDESMEDESSELENTNGGSHSSPLSNLVNEETESDGTEDEFWVKYPYLKELVEIIVAQGLISEEVAFERVKLIGDDKAKELNDGWKALCLKEQDLGNQMLELLASSTTKP
ncbi:unnamed protein product [Arabidopsis halleri]